MPGVWAGADTKLDSSVKFVGNAWIGAGRVRVNGKLIQTPDHWVERDRVTLDGKPVRPEERRYLLLYKPKGYYFARRSRRPPHRL